ncbi:uncharacterized protein LOC143066725 [Mytilus galloprovincialis]|uniref:uncharacterized protein LOC143066725 n=1 Tax=Mytilus galloprovincialis TaxID=29158 RepID=UPI003F7B5527
MKNLKKPTGQTARWLEELGTYNLTVTHRAGRKHSNADALSRRPCKSCERQESGNHTSDDETDEIQLEETDFVNQELHENEEPTPRIEIVRVCTRSQTGNQSSATPSGYCIDGWDPDSIRQCQLEDPDMSLIVTYLQEKKNKPDWDQTGESHDGIPRVGSTLEEYVRETNGHCFSGHIIGCELFPGKQTKAATNQLSPLKTPSTSDIILEDDSDNEEPEILEEPTSQKKGRKTTEKEEERYVEKIKKKTNHQEQKAKKIKKGKDYKKQDEEMTLTEEGQKRTEKQEQEEIKRKEEEHKKRETPKQEEEVRLKEAEQKRKEKQEQEEIKRKEEEHKKQETRKQEEEVRLKEAEQKRKEKQEQEEIKRKEEEHKKQETRKQEEEVRLKEAEHKRKEKQEQEEIRQKEEERKKQEKQKQEEEVRLKEAEQKRREKHKQDEEIRMKEEELRRQEEAETKRLAEETRSNEAELMRLQEGENLQSEQFYTASERADKLLRRGGMPLFPAGRREWEKEEIVTLITIPAEVKWPPKNWKNMTPEQRYFNWEYASIALELNTGKQLQFSKEELLLKYHFLALPGTKTPQSTEGNTMTVKSRYYLYQAIANIIKSKTDDPTTLQLLDMIEASSSKRDTSTDIILNKIDAVGVQLRLGEDQ